MSVDEELLDVLGIARIGVAKRVEVRTSHGSMRYVGVVPLNVDERIIQVDQGLGFLQHLLPLLGGSLGECHHVRIHPFLEWPLGAWAPAWGGVLIPVLALGRHLVEKKESATEKKREPT